jgi:glycosyltransferase involved in cell wall biosynthesis
MRETAETLVRQSAIVADRLHLQFILCDGGSTDDTVEHVVRTLGERAIIISEADTGMYDALAKGLRLAEGDFVTYLNAGDLLFPWAFDVLADVTEARPDVRWLCGWSAICNESSQVTNVKLPYKYRRKLIERGMYGRYLPWIQQEGVFWSRDLNAMINLDKLASLRLAGDYFLWKTFARRYELHVVQALIGVFRRHEGQLSSARRAYHNEVNFLKESPRPWDFATAAWDNVMWWMPPRAKKAMNPSGQIAFDHVLKRWR